MKSNISEIKLAQMVVFHEFVPLETMVIPWIQKKSFFYVYAVE